MTTTRSIGIAALFSLTLAAPALAGEDITEHTVYEKRSMKIETGPVMATPTTTVPPSRVYEHHDESESITVEKHSAAPPAAVVKERTTKTEETKVEN